VFNRKAFGRKTEAHLFPLFRCSFRLPVSSFRWLGAGGTCFRRLPRSSSFVVSTKITSLITQALLASIAISVLALSDYCRIYDDVI